MNFDGITTHRGTWRFVDYGEATEVYVSNSHCKITTADPATPAGVSVSEPEAILALMRYGATADSIMYTPPGGGKPVWVKEMPGGVDEESEYIEPPENDETENG